MIRIMSFNIRYGSARDGSNDWEHRKGLVVQRILKFNPDMLGIQECEDSSQASFLKSQLGAYDFLGVRRGGPDSNDLEMAPLFFKKSAFQLLDAGFFWLSDTPEIAGSKAWNSQLPRTVTWAKLKMIRRPVICLFLNTHFDYAGLEAQVSSASLVKKFIARFDDQVPIVLTGDFNTAKDTAPYKILTEDGKGLVLKDAYRDQHPANSRSEGTLHGFGGLSEKPSIDWILVSKQFRTIQAGVDKFHINNIYPSDHFPVFAAVDSIDG